jgi:hypothetical protein
MTNAERKARIDELQDKIEELTEGACAILSEEYAEVVEKQFKPYKDEIDELRSGCAHESVTLSNGHGSYCKFCGETLS